MKNLLIKEIGRLVRCLFAALGLCLFILQADLVAEETMPRSHFLLLDSRVVEKVENAKLTVGAITKHPANPLFVEDKPWEKRFDNLYGNVIYNKDEKIYKCWYSPFIVDYSAKGMSLEDRENTRYEPPENREMAICYSTSKDGINWEKPELGIVRYGPNKANNILWRANEQMGKHWHGPHGAGIFKDFHEQDADRLYKAILKGNILSVAFSADGIHWKSPIACPEADVAGDTHNNAFWAPTLNKYVGITRTWGEEKGRQVARIESKDFIHWSSAEVVLEGIDKNHQTYAMPVFYYGGVYLGLVAIHDQKADRVWTELTWSPDTKHWNRISPGTPLIPNSPVKLDYDYGCVYACAYPVFLKNEIRLYYGGSDYLHFGWRTGSLCLATLRPDGFAGYEQDTPDKPAVITTSSIPYAGQAVRITTDIADNGWVKVSLLNGAGKTLSTARTLTKTVTDGRLTFLSEFESEKVRLKFEMSNARLYSFRLIQ